MRFLLCLVALAVMTMQAAASPRQFVRLANGHVVEVAPAQAPPSASVTIINNNARGFFSRRVNQQVIAFGVPPAAFAAPVVIRRFR